MKSEIKNALTWIFSFAAAICAAFLFTAFIAQRADVNGASMEPNFHNGDALIVNKFLYRFKDPERFDVVIFNSEAENEILIKRIIGLPGETIYIDSDGVIYIDGKELEESYGKETIKSAGRASEPITLGENEYFVLGDNRNNSLDSRFEQIGNIDKSMIIGKAVVRVYPFKDFEVL